MTEQKKYRCSVAPCDGMQVAKEANTIRLNIYFGNGIGHSTPVMLSKDEARRLAADLLEVTHD